MFFKFQHHSVSSFEKDFQIFYLRIFFAKLLVCKRNINSPFTTLFIWLFMCISNGLAASDYSKRFTVWNEYLHNYCAHLDQQIA